MDEPRPPFIAIAGQIRSAAAEMLARASSLVHPVHSMPGDCSVCDERRSKILPSMWADYLAGLRHGLGRDPTAEELAEPLARWREYGLNIPT